MTIHDLHRAEEMIDAAFSEPPARSIPVSLASSPVTDEGTDEEASAKRAEDAWSRSLDRRATLALCATAVGWTLLAGLVAFLVTRLPGEWRDLGAVGVVAGVAWVVRRQVG